MSVLPRLAIGSLASPRLPAMEPAAVSDPRLVALCLANVLARRRRQVQIFRGDARVRCSAAERLAAGVATWQLDSWLMPPATCQMLFALGCRGRDFALVEGVYGGGDTPSDLHRLADWLDLPRVVVLDARRLAGCGLPARSHAVDAVLLDHVSDGSHFCHLAANVEALWRVPVLGAMAALPAARARLRTASLGAPAWREALNALSMSMAQWTDLPRLARLAARPVSQTARPPAPTDVLDDLDAASTPVGCCAAAPANDADLAAMAGHLPGLKIAVAYDEAFGGYCPDALELIERWGAKVCDFSPLRDDRLPDGCDLVYLGCGRTAEYARELAQNTCMFLALHKHVGAGRRVLAEGAGLAYACTRLQDEQGRIHAMAGLLPAVATPRGEQPHVPVQARLARDCWLGPAGTWLRGYACDRWKIRTLASGCHALVDAPRHARSLVSSQTVIGSQLQLHYAARPDLLRAFFAPHQAAPAQGA